MDHHEIGEFKSSQQKLMQEAANRLFAKDCNFVTSAASEAGLPVSSLPEFAFAGRSNVGKSSLINALVNRKNLVKTSKTPGRTQQINFFNLIDTLMLVDLPGYGYAKASKNAIHEWNTLIENYLKGRTQLRRVFVLIDSRHGIKATDTKTMELLDEAAVSYQLVLTKTDKISASQLTRIHEQVVQSITKHPAAFPTVISTSSEKRIGLTDLRLAIQSLL